MFLVNIFVDSGRDVLMFFWENVLIGDSTSDVLVHGCFVISVIMKEFTHYSLCLIHCIVFLWTVKCTNENLSYNLETDDYV